jgi:hypothetical protein
MMCLSFDTPKSKKTKKELGSDACRIKHTSSLMVVVVVGVCCLSGLGFPAEAP